jgi:hypothetical protein
MTLFTVLTSKDRGHKARSLLFLEPKEVFLFKTRRFREELSVSTSLFEIQERESPEEKNMRDENTHLDGSERNSAV